MPYETIQYAKSGSAHVARTCVRNRDKPAATAITRPDERAKRRRLVLDRRRRRCRLLAFDFYLAVGRRLVVRVLVFAGCLRLLGNLAGGQDENRARLDIIDSLVWRRLVVLVENILWNSIDENRAARRSRR